VNPCVTAEQDEEASVSDPSGPTVEAWSDLLHTDEELQAEAKADDGAIAVTHRRVVIRRGTRVALDAPVEGLRRIQFDVERNRPATMVIVPNEPGRAPQVLAIPVDQLDGAARLMAIVGRRLSRVG
jgi:hypothetical protein